jgi:GTP-binding protein EngB required for normal cell division
MSERVMQQRAPAPSETEQDVVARETKRGVAALRPLDLIPAELLEPDERELVAAVRRRLSEGSLYVVALGEFKRGKSSVLNALLGEDVLPVGVVPLTSIVTLVRRGPRSAVAEYDDGRRESIDPARLGDFVTESGNPGNAKGLRSTELSVPTIDLPHQAVLVDTPGLGSVYESGTQHTLAFLPHVDVAMIVLSVDQTLSEAEEKLAAALREGGTEVLFVLNKADYLTGQELEQAVAFISGRLQARGLQDAPLFVVSAKKARSGEDDRGMRALVASLRTLLERRYETILERQSARRLSALLDDLETRYLVRDEIARRDTERLSRALTLLEKSRADVRRLADEQDAVFAHRVRGIERSAGERSAAFEQELRRALESEIERLADRLREDPAERVVDEALYAAISARLRAEAAHESHRVGQELGEAAERLSLTLDEAADSLAAATEEILGIKIARPQPASVGELALRIDIKLRDDPVALETLAGGLQATLPRVLRQRLVLRRARERAAELSNRHAGRLRSELQSALREAARGARRQSHEELDRLQRSLDQAIARGLAQREMAEDDAGAERERIERVLEAITRARALLGPRRESRT